VNVAARKAVWFLIAVSSASVVVAQTASIGAKARKRVAEHPRPAPAREQTVSVRNAVYDAHSWIVTRAPKPKTFRPGDLLTIIIRERKQWEAESDLETKKEWNIKSELKDFVQFTHGDLGASKFVRGKPNIEYKYRTKVRNEGDTSRDDRFTTRLTAKIIDVKPNGLLVLEGRARIAHDEEVTEVTITGTCRKEDITADNTILSTQIADKDVEISNEGALHAAATRGWFVRLLDMFKPF